MSSGDSAPGERARLMAAFVLTMLAGILFELPYLNGPWYWQWQWLNLGLDRTLVFLLPGGALIALGFRGMPSDGRPARVAFSLTCFAAGAFAMQGLGILAHPKGWLMVRDIVVSPIVTSYFNDAESIRNAADWLSRYHAAELGFHTGTHPPGCVLFWRAWILLAGPAAAPYAGAAAIAALSALGVPAAYRFAGLWTPRVEAKLLAAGLYACLPAPVQFFPGFDQVYPLVTMAVVGAWMRGLDGRPGLAAAAGAALAVGSFFAYNLLTLGAFLALSGAVQAVRRRTAVPVAGASAWALAGFLAVHGALALGTGFDAPASFLRSLALQAGHMQHMDRPWLACVVFDLYDFVLGGGFLLLVLGVDAVRTDPPWRPASAAGLLTGLGLATVLVVDLSGLLRAETARVWMFLQPFLVVPAALALERLPWRDRVNLLVLQFLTVAVFRCKMGFVLA
jgi:hypothetical protein